MTESFHPADAGRFQAAIARLDAENGRDANWLSENGVKRPRELVYSEWLTNWVLKLCPTASEALRLAARSQHLCRWMIPRESYPAGRAGYLQWRQELRKFHAQKAGEILRELGYGAEIIARVQDLNLKKNYPEDPESRVMEDALCLVFLKHQLSDVARKTPDDKLAIILQKTWKKMTRAAQALALELPYPAREKGLISALSGVGVSKI